MLRHYLYFYSAKTYISFSHWATISRILARAASSVKPIFLAPESQTVWRRCSIPSGTPRRCLSSMRVEGNACAFVLQMFHWKPLQCSKLTNYTKWLTVISIAAQTKSSRFPNCFIQIIDCLLRKLLHFNTTTSFPQYSEIKCTPLFLP